MPSAGSSTKLRCRGRRLRGGRACRGPTHPHSHPSGGTYGTYGTYGTLGYLNAILTPFRAQIFSLRPINLKLRFKFFFGRSASVPPPPGRPLPALGSVHPEEACLDWRRSTFPFQIERRPCLLGGSVTPSQSRSPKLREWRCDSEPETRRGSESAPGVAGWSRALEPPVLEARDCHRRCCMPLHLKCRLAAVAFTLLV